MKGFGRQCVEYINSTPKKQKEKNFTFCFSSFCTMKIILLTSIADAYN